jgi:formate/nitrite transporter
MAKPEMRLTIEPYSASEMAEIAERGGVTKAQLDVATTVALSVLAGAFIALGAMFSTVVATETHLGYGLTRLAVGLAFCLGLVLVVVGGAELFTGNNLMIMAWAHGKVPTGAVLRQWVIVYFGNFTGAVATAAGVYLSGIWKLDGYHVGATAVMIAAAKCSLTWGDAFMRGVYCNALVCLAVWLAYSARNTTDKILAVLFPITAFVAAGFEHSIANMYFIPIGLFLREHGEVLTAAAQSSADLTPLTWNGFLFDNLLPVTLGNILGGAVMVGLIYWFIYLRLAHRNS